MTEIRETVIVDCPYGQAPGYLDYYLRELAEPAGDVAILRLQVPLADLGIPGGIVVERNAIAKFAIVPDSHNVDHSIAVSWEPEGGGPFPRFAGFIILEADKNYGTSRLTLEGSYAPPLGAVGKVFDAALGRKLALATARRLLATLQGHLEQRHRHDYSRPTIPPGKQGP